MNPGHRGKRARLVIAVGFATAIAIVPVSAALSSEHGLSGSERSVAGCLPFTEICFPDPPPLLGAPAPSPTPAPAPPPENLPNTAPVVDANSPIDLDVENESGTPAPAPPPEETPPPKIIRFVIPSVVEPGALP
jgi:hypothetical protein